MSRRTRSTIVAAALAAVATAASAQISDLPAGYNWAPLSLPEPIQGAVAADATDPDVFYVSAGSFGNCAIYRVEFLSELTATATLVANGTANIAGAVVGDDILDNGFGAIGIVSLPNGDLIVADNSAGLAASGQLSEQLILLSDNNSDGDFLDAGEASTFALPIATSAGNFGGAGVARGADGSIYTITADGGGTGEVLKIDATGTAQHVFLPGLDFGGGVTAETSGSLVIGHTNNAFTAGYVARLTDANADNDAEDAGEFTYLAGPGIDPIYDVTASANAAEATIVASANGIDARLLLIDPIGGPTPFATVQIFATGLSFDRDPSRSFAPYSGPGGKRLLATDIFNLYVIVPATLSASATGWQHYE